MCQQCSAGGMYLWMAQLEPTPRHSFPLPRTTEMLRNTSLRNKADFQLSAFPLTVGGWGLRAQWRPGDHKKLQWDTALNQRINTKNCLYLWKGCRHIHTPAKSICTWQDLLCLTCRNRRKKSNTLISILVWKQHKPDYCIYLLKGRMHLCLHLFSTQMKEK